MDRALLERLLAEGLSLEQIGLRTGRRPSTVGYWLKKHGLRAANHDANAPKGGIERSVLEDMVARQMSVRDIARSLDRGYSTVRYWLRRYGLSTSPAWIRGRPEERPDQVCRVCRKHGLTEFVAVGPRRYYRCGQCRVEGVAARRRRVKEILVSEAGGRCRLCGYDRFQGALEFHHVDPSKKEFMLSLRGLTRSIDRLRAEAAKCVLLCATCHAEVEGGIVTLPACDARLTNE